MFLRRFVLFSLVMMWSVVSLSQVDTGAIVGTVVDGERQAVPDAAVILRQTETGAERRVASGHDGSFSFSPLTIGTYVLTVERDGFARYQQTGLTVTAQARLQEDVTLQVGEVTQTVEVQSTAPLLESQSSSVQQLVDARRINNLPLNGRNVTFLAQTSAGVTIAQADSRGLAASGSFSANGSRRGQNNYLLDGIDNNAAIADYVNQTQYVIMPPPDAVQEFVVQTSNYSAEFGHSAGAVLNASTKSGGDAFHGDVWEFFRNDALDARNYFATAAKKPAYHQNQFGGAAGGPVVIPKLYNGRGKTFFFADYQGTRISQNSSRVVTVPTAQERNSGFTNFSELITLQSGKRTDALGRTFATGTIFDPATTRPVTAGKADTQTGLVAGSTGYVRDPIYNGAVGGQIDFTTAAQIARLNQLPVSRLNSSALALLRLYPVPTAVGVLNNYTSFPAVTNNSDGIDVRVDEHFSEKDTAFARYSYLDTDQVNPGPFTGVADGQASRPGNGWTQAQNVALSETHIFSSTIVNEARAGYSRVVDIRKQPFANQLGLPAQYGIGGIPQYAGNGGLPSFTFGALANLGQTGSLPSNKASIILQFSDNVTYSRGRHVMRVGGLYQRIAYPTSTPSASRGAFGFSGIYTSVVNQTDGTTDVAQMLLNPQTATVPGGINNVGGANSVSASSFPPISNLRRWYLGAYVQDDWRALPKLTLNVGVRYEYFGVPHERDDRQTNFIPGPMGTPQVGARLLVPQSQLGQLPQAYLNLLSKDNIAVAPTENAGLGEAQSVNFAPRFGLALQANERLVLRAGYGLFFGGYENLGLSASPPANFPYNVAASYTAANAATPLTADGSIGTLAAGLTNVPLTASSATPANTTLLGRQYNWKSAYTQSYNLQVQYEIDGRTVLKVGYVGTQSQHLQTPVPTNTLNTILPASANAQASSFFPDFARGGTFVVPQGSSNYNALQIDVTRQWAQGLTLNANYTRSKCLGNARDLLDNNIGSYRAPYVAGAGLGFDYGYCDIDVRNITHFNGTYVLPFGKDHAWLTHGVGSYVAGGWSLQWLATVQEGQPLTVPCTTTTAAGLGCNAVKVAGQDPYAGLHNARQFLNAAAFANPSATSGLAVLGGAPTQVSGPAYRKLDLSLFRQFPLVEGTRLELRAEGFNITNTPNFSAPGNLAFTSPATFASITSTRDNARQLQLAAKIYW